MAAITVSYTNVVLSSSSTNITLEDGNFALDVSDGFTLSGTVPFTSLSLSTQSIDFQVAQGTTFTGSVVVDVTTTTAGTPPQIEIDNFSTGTVNVKWPTNKGSHNQNLEPGNSLPLTGYNG